MTRIVAVLLLLALLAAACGGAESDGAEKWAAAANGLCRDLERELAAVDPPREVEEPDELSAFVAGTAASVKAWIGRMRELESPPDDADRVERMLDDYGEAVTLTEQAAAALDVGDEEGYLELVRAAERPSARGDRIARQLGARTCAYPLSG